MISRVAAWTLIFIALAGACIAQDTRSVSVIAQDTAGLVVEVKEKYGGVLIDTGTVLMYHTGQFVLTKKNGLSDWFPASFHSVRVLEKLTKEVTHESD